jgi:hypothetical protein
MQPYDPESLDRAIRTYLKDSELSRKHDVAARAWVLREFRQEEIRQAVYEEHLELLEKKRIPAPDTGMAATLGDSSKKVGRAERRLVKTSC